jgi:hypothetical protein
MIAVLKLIIISPLSHGFATKGTHVTFGPMSPIKKNTSEKLVTRTGFGGYFGTAIAKPLRCLSAKD